MPASDPAQLPHRPRGRRAPRRARLLPRRAALVDALPDLADRLSPERLERARVAVQARVVDVRRGTWDAEADARDLAAQSFIALEGSVLRRVKAEHREAAELLGPGDLLQPRPDHQAESISWRTVTECRLLVLDGQALADAGAVPEITGALLAAAHARTNAIARQLVIAQWPSMDARLVAALQVLSERWGVVTPDGLVLPEFLTHSVLAPLVGARRPSVTTALKRLAAAGTVRRAADGRWILHHG